MSTKDLLYLLNYHNYKYYYMKNFFIYIYISVLMVMVCACSSDNNEPARPTNEKNSAPNKTDIAQFTPPLSLYPEDNEFAFMDTLNVTGEKMVDLVGKLTKTSNICFSPLYTYTGLNMVINSSLGSTSQNLMNAIEATDYELLNILNYKCINKLPDWIADNSRVAINHIWTSQPTTSEAYQKLMSSLFNAQVTYIDFTQTDTQTILNNRFENTPIDSFGDLVDQSCDLNSLGSLFATVLYFHPKHLRPIETVLIDNFNSPDGVIPAKMMQNKGFEYMYAENDIAQMVTIGLDFGTLNMELYLPKQDIAPEEITNVINRDVRAELRKKSKNRHIALTIPMFDITYCLDFSKIAPAFGITNLDQTDLALLGVENKSKFSLLNISGIIFDNDCWSATISADIPYHDTKPQTTMTINRPFLFVVNNSFIDSGILAGVITNPLCK